MADPDSNAPRDTAEPQDTQPQPLVAEELDALRASVVDAASVSGSLWITYLGVLFYLLIAIGSVTHKDLFLESPIKLPFMNVDLPMKGFFLFGPALFLIVHAYLLLHFVLLAGKIAALDQALGAQIVDHDARAKLRTQLPANIFVQFLAGPSEVRDGVTGVFLWLIALISLVLGPVLLLLFFELQFLPYHNDLVTWWQRIAVELDLVLLWLFWPAIALRESEAPPVAQTRFLIARRIQRVGTIGILLTLTLGSPLLLLVGTFPGDVLQKVEIPGRAMLIDGRFNPATLRPESPFSSHLVLPKFDAIDQAKLDSKEKIDFVSQTIAVYGRDLQGANLRLADLRKVNFIFSRLTGANLGSARLTGARLDHADLTDAKLGYADLTGANLDHADLDRADLDHADLTNANLTTANLNGANLTDAKITQSQLNKACGQQATLPSGLTLEPC